jgi:hypothetical protein
MTKKGPLGKAEEFYVEHHCNISTVEEIATELDRPKSTIRKKVEKYRKDAGLGTVGSQIARQDGIAIMTENASAMSDESKKEAVARPKSCTTGTTK